MNAAITKIGPNQEAMLWHGDCVNFVASLPRNSVRLVVTSPPYLTGKAYEGDLSFEAWYHQQETLIHLLADKVLVPGGSVCWQTGNYVTPSGGIVPLDSVLYELFTRRGFVLRNRIVWHFRHGLHCKNRFSGRYEVISWYTLPGADYVFNLDAVRVPQRYPNKKHFKGPKVGQLSCNPAGANPGDCWDIPNVKCNHVEKTRHPCQFPVELAERLVLALSNPGDLVIDPFMGVGTTLCAAVRNGRKGAGSELVDDYVRIAATRVGAALDGTLRVRAPGPAVFEPASSEPSFPEIIWNEDGRLLEVYLSNESGLAEWIPGEDADVALLRSDITRRVVGCALRPPAGSNKPILTTLGGGK